MRRWLPLWLLVLIGCGLPDDIENSSVAVDFGGFVLADGLQTPISGVRTNLVQLDSMNAAGMGVTVTSDTSSSDGSWLMRVEVARIGTACENRNRLMMVTLRFTDPRNRFVPTLLTQTICRFTAADLSTARNLSVSMVAN